MKSLKIFIIILGLISTASISHAYSWRDGFGEYHSVLPQNFTGDAFIEPYGDSGIFLTIYNRDPKTPLKWGQAFTCKGLRCETTVTSLGGTPLVLPLIFSPEGYVTLEQSKTFYRFKKIRGAGNSPSDPSSPWMNKEYADTSQVIYSAYQTDKLSGATLVLSCKAKSEQISWAIRLNEKSYLAVLGAVLSAKATLKVDGKVDSGTTQTSPWSVADNRYIVPVQNTPLSIADLKKGSQVIMTLTAMKPDSSEVKLEAMSFSLKGSTAALNKLQEGCSPNSNTDLPIPLP